MHSRLIFTLSTVLLALTSGVTFAAGGTAVPEIDGASTALAIGLTAGLVALVRERRRRK